jgi:hypothetical protein
MPFDEGLARQVRDRLAGHESVSEKGMFGGLAFFVDGNLCVGVIRQNLVARVGPERSPAALERPGVRPFDLTGRPMSGWVMVAPMGYPDAGALAGWVQEALDYVLTLPRQPVA